MFASAPKTLNMACRRNPDNATMWDCKSPRILNVAFSMPDSAAYAAGNLHFNIFYSLKLPTNTTVTSIMTGADTTIDSSYVLPFNFETSSVYTKTKKDQQALASTEFTDPMSLLVELVSSSEYTLEYMSDLAMGLDTCVRLTTFFLSFWFVLYWCYCMGVQGFCKGGNKEKKGGESMIWGLAWLRWLPYLHFPFLV